jgi:hypothetical protein
MNIVNIFLAVMVVVIIALQILNVPISQRAVNLVYGFILLILIVVNSGWIGIK